MINILTKSVLTLLILSEVRGLHYANETNIAADFRSPTPCTDASHMFLAPGVLSSGAANRGCLSRFHTEGSAHLLLSLRTVDQQTATFQKELAAGDGGCIDFTVPQLPNTKAELTIRVTYPQWPCSWERTMSLRISSSRVVYIQLERRRYRPGDLVRARLLCLRSDFSPRHSPIEEAWLEGPSGAWGEGVRVIQWHKVRTRLGIAQVQYKLDGQAAPGRWIFRAKLADGSQGSAEFWVGDYKIPSFQLSVKHSPRVLRTSERLVWTVCVRYPWSEAVEGMLVIRLRGAGGGSGVRTAVRLRAPRPCHTHALAARRINAHRGDVVVADFSFQEDGTGVWQNTTVISQVVDDPISLEFVLKNTLVIEAGLPYKVKVKATSWNGKPAPHEPIQICKTPIYHLSEITNEDKHFIDNNIEKRNGKVNSDKFNSVVCNNTNTDNRGVARALFFGVTGDTAKFYRFDASSKNSTIHAEPFYLPVSSFGYSHAALGPLEGVVKSPGARFYMPLYLNLKSYRKPLTIHFVMITRGGNIFRWGATIQCATNTNNIHSTTHNSECPLDNYHGPSIYNVNQTEESVQELLNRQARVMIPVKVSNQMCPNSHLITYFYYNGELVSASKYLEFEDCFVNKAEIFWLPRQVSPSSTASLYITTTPSSLCGLSALDVASKWQMDPALGLKETLMDGLNRYMGGNRNMTGFDALGDCYALETPIQPSSSIELTTTWLAESGVRVAGGGMRTSRYCEVVPPAPLVDFGNSMPRSDFSESWLWRLIGVGINGSITVNSKVPDSITRFEATAFCISKTGVAIAQPATLQVFREFFIHTDAPKRLSRGDSTLVQYRIFNYLYEPLSIQIQILSDPHLEILSPLIENACISARASIVRRSTMRARIQGHARVTIRAQGTGDPRCGNGTFVNNAVHNVSYVSDQIIMQIEIEPEGVKVRESKSTLLCARENSQSQESDMTWTWPNVDSIPGTESLTLWAVADVSGPLYTDADALVTLPRGCGEQNMARLATNMLALSRLDATTPAAITALDHVARGFSRQIQFAHPSGGFSAFGSADGTPSTSLTAFSIRYMRKAHQILNSGSPAPAAIERAERWLLSQQMENGCFRKQGLVFHREFKGGIGEEGDISNVAFTAYVVTSLIEGGVVMSAKVLKDSLSCLRAMPLPKAFSVNRVYSQALLTYTFMRLKKYEDELRRTNEASFLWERREPIGAGLKEYEDMQELTDLLKLAKRSDDYVFWETGSLSTSIEATGYALLSLALCVSAHLDPTCNDLGRGAVRWISMHRDTLGGFLSTQDTLIALEALTAWSLVQPSLSSRLNVTAQVGGQTQAALLEPETSRIPVLMKMRDGQELKVAVYGTGCALVQATRTYNTLRPQNEVHNKMLSVQTSVKTDGPFNCDNETCFCAAIVESCVLWTGQFPEMALLEVTLPGGYGADASRLYSQMEASNTLIRRIELSGIDRRATFYLGTKNGNDVTTSTSGYQCYHVHAVGPRTRTKPAYVKLLDYYRPNVNDTQIYTIPEDCPPRVAHNTIHYIESDNLFASARSLTDDEEFTFEEIPDDIPLEDPIYDNLRKANIDPKLDTNKKGFEIDNYEKFTNIESTDNKPDKGVSVVSSNNYKERNENNKVTRITAENLIDTEEILKNATIYNEKEQTKNINKSNTNNKNNAKPSENKTDEINEISKKDTKRDIIEEEKPDEITNEQGEDKKVITNDNAEINANFENFHVIDSATDLEVPTGIEGPVPSVVLPPPGFVPPKFEDFKNEQPSRIIEEEQPKKFRHYPTYYIQPPIIYYRPQPYLREPYGIHW